MKTLQTIIQKKDELANEKERKRIEKELTKEAKNVEKPKKKRREGKDGT